MLLEPLIFKVVGISRRKTEIEPSKAADDSLNDIKKLIAKANESIKVVSGEIPFSVYCSDGLVNATSAALDRDVVIELIAGPEADRKSLEMLTKNGIIVYELPFWPSPHYIIVDGKHVRLEEPHKHNQRNRTSYIVHNYKYAPLLENKFEALKEKSKVWPKEGANG